MLKSNEQEALSGLADRAQALAGPHVPRPQSYSARNVNHSLAALHGRSVTVRLAIAGRALLVTGQAAYELDEGLCITLDDEPRTEIRIDECRWNGRIVEGLEHGSDFLIRLDAETALSPATN